MDERAFQLVEMKKEYKRARAKAGWGYKTFAWIFGVITVILGIMTVFVLLNTTAWVQVVDSMVWEPLKAAVPLGIDYAGGWRLMEQYGIYAVLMGLLVTVVFGVLGHIASQKVKTREVYLNYRTLKLTLEAEKEEK